MSTLETNQLFHSRYRLIFQKGAGSFGEVWLARDEQLDLEVALKIYVALDDRGIEEFREEFKTAWTLNHPNLLHAYYYDVDDRRPFLVMPYCPGKAEELVGTTDETEIWKFIRDVSSGLAYIHDKDIVHHDIKPDNILKSAEGTYMITDFGISQRMRSTLRRNSTRQIGNSTEIAGGSLPYMAPEMFSGMPEAVKATDIWALGVTLFEIVTGDLPFFGQGGGMQLHGAELPQIKTNFSDDLKSIITACLKKDTWDRPTAQQLYDYATAKLNGQKAATPWNTKNHKADRPRREKRPSEKRVKRSTKNRKPVLKSNKLAPTCLWIATLCGLALTVLFTVLSYGCEYSAIVAAFSEAIIFIGGIILLRKSKLGFWIIAITQIICTIWYCCILYSDPEYEYFYLVEKIAGPFFMASAIIGIPLLHLILKKTTNEKYAWGRMNRRFPVWMIFGTFAILLAVYMISCRDYIGAHKNLETYLSLVEKCDSIIYYNENVTLNSLEEASDILPDIKEYEDKYKHVNSKYNNYDGLQASISKISSEIKEANARAELEKVKT
ncbi:MAG: serine/threonine protein kinase, partial [Prevotella sp.]|nr:serine/threonine protein kinase [Prevotella sp.]